MGANSAPKPLRQRHSLTIGPKMREAWCFIRDNSGCTDHVIRINYGGRVLQRLIAGGMVSTKSTEHGVTRCYAQDPSKWQHKLSPRSGTRQTAYHQARERVNADPATYSVPCLRRDCLAPVGQPCTKTTFYGRAAQGPHYERLLMITDKLLGSLLLSSEQL